MISLESKTALVTGAGQGIGRGIALELAKAGANVVIADINETGANQVVTEVLAIGRKGFGLRIDVAEESSIRDCVDRAIAQFTRIDILVNNAGVIGSLNEDAVTADLDLCYDVNVRGVWCVSRALIPHFRRNGAGKIVNIASTAGRKGAAGASAAAYCASKAAVISLTQSFAGELGANNINVNAVCPGPVWTPMWESIEKSVARAASEEQLKARPAFTATVAATTLKRPTTPDDVGHAVVFLASDYARNITGQCLNVCGGSVMN